MATWKAHWRKKKTCSGDSLDLVYTNIFNTFYRLSPQLFITLHHFLGKFKMLAIHSLTEMTGPSTLSRRGDFRRTDCHFFVARDDCEQKWLPDVLAKSSIVNSQVFDWVYKEDMQDLINAKNGCVYLDTDTPRVCVRGPLDESYSFLTFDHIFPFYELRAAAEDMRELLLEGNTAADVFEPARARQRIVAQLGTLKTKGVRHVVLSAFGCGAFMQPADQVAQIYVEELKHFKCDFDVVAFAIYSPAGFEPNNWTPFKCAFEAEASREDRVYDISFSPR